MLKHGILNPAVNALLSRVRHTNTIVIADRGFPYWPQVETIDLSLVDDIPTVWQVLHALRAGCVFGRAWMAQEFVKSNEAAIVARMADTLGDLPLIYEAHVDFKKRVPRATGLIRTGDTTPYANILLESA